MIFITVISNYREDGSSPIRLSRARVPFYRDSIANIVEARIVVIVFVVDDINVIIVLGTPSRCRTSLS